MKFFCIIPKENESGYSVKVYDEPELNFLPSVARYMSSIIVSDDGKVIKNRYGTTNFPCPKGWPEGMGKPEIIIRLSKEKNEMNKAQKQYTQDFNTNYYGQRITSEILHIFTSGFTAIDPSPDPETYCIWLKDKWVDKAKHSNLSKEDADQGLMKIMLKTFGSSVIEYKKGDYFLALSGARYEIRKEI